MGGQWSLAADYHDHSSILMGSVLCQCFLRERTRHVDIGKLQRQQVNKLHCFQMQCFLMRCFQMQCFVITLQ